MFARWWDLALCLASSGNTSWPSCGCWQMSVTTASCHRYTGNVLYVQDVTALCFILKHIRIHHFSMKVHLKESLRLEGKTTKQCF